MDDTWDGTGLRLAGCEALQCYALLSALLTLLGVSFLSFTTLPLQPSSRRMCAPISFGLHWTCLELDLEAHRLRPPYTLCAILAPISLGPKLGLISSVPELKCGISLLFIREAGVPSSENSLANSFSTALPIRWLPAGSNPLNNSRSMLISSRSDIKPNLLAPPQLMASRVLRILILLQIVGVSFVPVRWIRQQEMPRSRRYF